MLSKTNSKCNEVEITAKVFPLIQLVSQTKEKRYSGILMTALRKSTTARLAKRMFGKLRRFLNRTKIAMKDPLPIIETKVKLVSMDDMITLLAKVFEAIMSILIRIRVASTFLKMQIEPTLIEALLCLFFRWSDLDLKWVSLMSGDRKLFYARVCERSIQ